MTSSPQSARFAFQLLRAAFIVVPLFSGFDKLAGVLVDWERYVSPAVAAWSPLPVEYAIGAVGLLEIGLALLVIARPRVGSLVLAGWFGASAVNFAFIGEHWQIAFRDLGLAMGAVALSAFARLPELAPASSGGGEPRSPRRARGRSPRSDTLVSASDE